MKLLDLSESLLNIATLFTTDTYSKYLHYTNECREKEVRKDHGMGVFTVLNIIRIGITVKQNVYNDNLPSFSFYVLHGQLYLRILL